MKKVFSCVLAAVLCIGLLAGCGESEQEEERVDIDIKDYPAIQEKSNRLEYLLNEFGMIYIQDNAMTAPLRFELISADRDKDSIFLHYGSQSYKDYNYINYIMCELSSNTLQVSGIMAEAATAGDNAYSPGVWEVAGYMARECEDFNFSFDEIKKINIALKDGMTHEAEVDEDRFSMTVEPLKRSVRYFLFFYG